MGYWPLGQKCSIQSALISAKVNLRHFQTTKWSNRDPFSISQKHQGPVGRWLTKMRKSRFWRFSGWPYGARGSIGNFQLGLWDWNPDILYGLACPSQNLKSEMSKMAECKRGPKLDPNIISLKSRSGLLAVGAKVFNTKCSDISQSEPQTLPNNQMKQ